MDIAGSGVIFINSSKEVKKVSYSVKNTFSKRLHDYYYYYYYYYYDVHFFINEYTVT